MLRKGLLTCQNLPWLCHFTVFHLMGFSHSGLVTQRIPSDPRGQNGSQQEPSQLLCRGGAAGLWPQQHATRHWAEPWQDAAGNTMTGFLLTTWKGLFILLFSCVKNGTWCHLLLEQKGNICTTYPVNIHYVLHIEDAWSWKTSFWALKTHSISCNFI